MKPSRQDNVRQAPEKGQPSTAYVTYVPGGEPYRHPKLQDGFDGSRDIAPRIKREGRRVLPLRLFEIRPCEPIRQALSHNLPSREAAFLIIKGPSMGPLTEAQRVYWLQFLAPIDHIMRKNKGKKTDPCFPLRRITKHVT